MDLNTRLMASMLIPIGLMGCFQSPDPGSAINGTWEPVRVSVASARPTLRYDWNDNWLQMSSSAGESYSAQRGGDAVALKGAPPGIAVSVEQVPAFAYREVVLRDGKRVAVRIVAVVDRQIVTVLENRFDGSATIYALRKR